MIAFVLIEFFYYNIPKNYLDIRCVDVGQGDAIFVDTNDRRKILIDGGGSETYDVGENILLPYLLDMKVMHIDTIFSSHADTDHLAGIITVLENIKVDRIVIGKDALGYEKVYEIARKKNIDIIYAEKGDIIKIGDVTFEVIWPAKDASVEDINEHSLVFKMIYGTKSMLFTGDIGEKTEKKLYNLKSDVLKVGHHGSKYSSSEIFLKEVSPRLSIISVGKNNKYGHPDSDIILRLKKISEVFSTAESGEIRIKMYKNYITVSNYT